MPSRPLFAFVAAVAPGEEVAGASRSVPLTLPAPDPVVIVLDPPRSYGSRGLHPTSPGFGAADLQKTSTSSRKVRPPALASSTR